MQASLFPTTEPTRMLGPERARQREGPQLTIGEAQAKGPYLSV